MTEVGSTRYGDRFQLVRHAYKHIEHNNSKPNMPDHGESAEADRRSNDTIVLLLLKTPAAAFFVP
jgi:hypothetical protein